MPKRSIKIVPAILAKNKTDFKKQFDKVRKDFNYFQIDIMDGRLTGQKNAINPTNVQNMLRGYKVEVHLMVTDIVKYVNQWTSLYNVKKIIWHWEAEKNKDANICLAKWLRANGIQPGLAVNPNTSLAKIKDVVKYFHTIQIMGVTPGKQGQRFQPKVLKKIKALRKKYPNLNIAVDGGINDKNFRAVKKAGANIICIGSYFQNSENTKQNLKKLH